MASLFFIVIVLFVLAWWFLWKKQYYVQIESVGNDTDSMVQVIKTYLEITLTDAQDVAKNLPKLVKGGNLPNAYSVAKAFKDAGGQATIKYYPAWSNPLGKEAPEVDENGKKVKRPDSDAAHSVGGVNFTPDDINSVTGNPNKAYAKLAEAMQVGGDNFYPETKEETERMDALLDESEKASAGITDPEYFKVLKDMRGIVGWSARRHFNFSWLIILGSLILIGAVVYMGYDKREYKKTQKAKVEQVEAWSTKKDTIPLERALEIANYNNRLQSPNMYRADLINEKEGNIEYYKNQIEKYQQQLDTATIKSNKDYYKNKIQSSQKEIDQITEELKDINTWDEKATKKAALKDRKHWYKIAAKDARRGTIFMIIFILLIPLYIFANYSYGYVITKTRTESKILGKITEWTYKIAGGMFGLGLLIPTLKYDKRPRGLSSNDGKNGVNAILWAIKLCLLMGAVVLVSAVSFIIMIYSIIVGLKRNYGKSQKSSTAPAK